MTCFFCKGNMESGTTVHTVELKNCIVVIKNVPCHKCEQCGEIVIDGEVAERIEQIVSGFEKVLTEIAVVNYSVA